MARLDDQRREGSVVGQLARVVRGAFGVRRQATPREICAAMVRPNRTAGICLALRWSLYDARRFATQPG